jgi:hypothetical protein
MTNFLGMNVVLSKCLKTSPSLHKAHHVGRFKTPIDESINPSIHLFIYPSIHSSILHTVCNNLVKILLIFFMEAIYVSSALFGVEFLGGT